MGFTLLGCREAVALVGGCHSRINPATFHAGRFQNSARSEGDDQSYRPGNARRPQFSESCVAKGVTT
jgi:hypothetical protein